MPVQSDSLFNTVKQGSGLFKESSEATSSLASKAGLPQTPSTPLETAVIGGSPSQSKMAGTPAALKKQAAPIKLPTSLLLATQQRREQIDPTLTQAQEQAVQLSQRLQGLGSLGQRVPQLISTGVANAIQGKSAEPTLDTSKVAPDKLAEVSKDVQLLTKIWDPKTAGGKTEAEFKQEQMDAAARISQATGKSPQDLTGPDLGGLLTKTETSLSNALDAASLNQINLGDLEGGAAALGYPDWVGLATDLGIQIPEGKTADEVMAGLTVKELGEAVDTVKRRGFQTQQDWLAVLQDPTASPSDRSIARKILQQMGASGVQEAESRVAQLAEQVQASNTVNVNLTGTSQSIQIQDILTNPNLKAAIAVLQDPTNAAYQAVKADNPALAEWVDKNRDQLQNITKDVTQDAKDLATLNFGNAQVLKLNGLDDKTQDRIGKLLFPDWGKVTGTKYDLNKAPLLRDWSKLPVGEQTQVASALAAIADGGTDTDIQTFLNTDRNNLIRLGLNTQDGVDKFKAYWTEFKLIRSIGDISSLTNTTSQTLDLTGRTPDQLNELNQEFVSLQKAGLGKGLQLPATLGDALTKAKTGPQNMGALLAGNGIPKTIRKQIDDYTAQVDALKQSEDVVTQKVTQAILDTDGKLTPDVVNRLATDLASNANPTVALDNVLSLQKKTGMDNSSLASLRTKLGKDIFNTSVGGIPKLDDVLNAAAASPEKAAEYLQSYRGLSGKVTPGIQGQYDRVVAGLQQIVNKVSEKQEADRKARVKQEVQQAAQRQHERSLPVITSSENIKKGWDRLVNKGLL